jgi:hypothetical protein
MDIVVQLNLGEFSSFLGQLRSADFSEALDEAAETYLSLMQSRYVAQSRGGWYPLAPYTNAERVRLGFPPVQPILVRDGTLYGALTRGMPGNVWNRGRDRLSVGIGGNAVHPGYGEGGQHPTIGQIAYWHQTGTSKLPVREILTPPDGIGLSAIGRAVAFALQRIIDRIARVSKGSGSALAPGIAAAP